ncbi:hypothetical protein [Flavobacterium sp. DG2-3]|uniref:hypothetical protein n=1 Tax=Flavobacterium sp. DG2-3 TaxID=3068317 RepID=UPI00273FDF3F|nr:hypothetical protein [Flavobacterium sp. DG2-3]MDP5199660.1 hypothetical protein [Flavobacterium sp. DG2-3]
MKLADFLECNNLIQIGAISKLTITKRGKSNPEIILNLEDKEKISTFLDEFSTVKNDMQFVTMMAPPYDLILEASDFNSLLIGILPEVKSFRIPDQGTDIEFEQDFLTILKKYPN